MKKFSLITIIFQEQKKSPVGISMQFSNICYGGGGEAFIKEGGVIRRWGGGIEEGGLEPLYTLCYMRQL